MNFALVLYQRAGGRKPPPNEDRAVEVIGTAMLDVRDDTPLARHAG